MSRLRRWLFSTDHKVVGLQYLVTSLLFVLTGFCLIMLLRWQLAFPGQPIPVIGRFFRDDWAPGGIMLPEFYNQLSAMHGTIMVFLGIVPLGVFGFGSYFVPLMAGAPSMAFPRLHRLAYLLYLTAGTLMLASFIMPGGAAQSGWTSYPPLAVFNPGQTWWLVAMLLLEFSSVIGAINIIVTAMNMRANGMTLGRLPIFVWSQVVAAVLLLLAFPPLSAAAVLQFMDRVAGTSFYLPAGLIVNGEALKVSGGGQPLLWQHLFWFLAHPEVYVLILPGMGIASEIIANNTRKPLYGYRATVGSMLFLGWMSFLVWAHHMFVSGMSATLSKFFLVTTLIISIPSVAILTCLVISLKGASIRYNVPMLFALAFLPFFGIGGLTGLPLGLAVTDMYLHDTYYVIGHFHFVVVTGSLIAMMGGIYYWFPKWFGRRMNDFWGYVHFFGTATCMFWIFFPMLLQGLGGMLRRGYDPTQQTHNLPLQHWHVVISYSAWTLFLFQVPFIVNFFYSMFRGKPCAENPWQATTLEWACSSPPPPRNFPASLRVYRGPYEYSVPGRDADWLPQDAEAEAA